MIIVAWMVLGLVSAFVGRQVSSRPTHEIWFDVVVGVAGGVVGGFLFTMVSKGGGVQVGGWATVVSLMGSVVGAIAVLVACRTPWLRRLTGA